MDHVVHPQDAAFPRVIVPYYGDMYKYDGLSFTEYPVRCGFDKAKFYSGDFNTVPSTEQNSFFQAWLFFGLIHEFFGVNLGKGLDDDFIVDHDKGKRVTTARLLDWAKTWERVVARLPQSMRKSECERLDACLWEARQVIVSLNNLAEAEDECNDLSGEVVLSIIVLGLTLNSTRRYFSSSGVVDTHRLSGPGNNWPISEFARKRLEAAGWCKFEVSRLGSYVSTSGMLYCGSMRRFAIGRTIDHSRCSKDQCAAENIDEGTYRTAHSDGCKRCEHDRCEHDGPNVLHVKSVLAKNSFPVIELTKSETTSDICIKVLSFCEPMPYTAISHVWADGLGNPHANTLPQCQILRLYRLLESNYLTSRPAWMWKTNTVYLWMDTFCVPTSDETFRKKAISLMYEVYSKAKMVLVLDHSLLSISSERHPEDLFYRITASRWMGRAWTFQEGSLAESLCVQFADKAINVKDFAVSQYMESAFSDISQTIFESGMAIMNIHRPQQIDFDSVCQGLRFRSTSRSEDKLLCFAIMLGLNLDSMMKAKGDCRTLEVYQQLEYIPRAHLWHLTPRLDIPGFRWAPKDFFSVNVQTGTQKCGLAFGDHKLLFRTHGIVCLGLSCYMTNYKSDHFTRDFTTGKWYNWHWLPGEYFDGAAVKSDALWTALAVIAEPLELFSRYFRKTMDFAIVIRLDWDPNMATRQDLSNYIRHNDTISGEYWGRGALELCNQTQSSLLECGWALGKRRDDNAEAIRKRNASELRREDLRKGRQIIKDIEDGAIFEGEMRGSEQKWCVT